AGENDRRPAARPGPHHRPAPPHRRTVGSSVRRRARPVRGEGTIPPAAGRMYRRRISARTARTRADERFAVPDLPPRASLEYLRKQPKNPHRASSTTLSQAQHDTARDSGSVSWPRLVHHLQAARLHGIERALVLADAAELSSLLAEDATAATTPV